MVGVAEAISVLLPHRAVKTSLFSMPAMTSRNRCSALRMAWFRSMMVSLMSSMLRALTITDSTAPSPPITGSSEATSAKPLISYSWSL